ncbi:MAG: NYN domain-containing protein [Parachlamydiales bacterium]|nr:NYN domain-containing protein [Parachlamydiales bacterium]
MHYYLDGYNFLFRVSQLNRSLKDHREELLQELATKSKLLRLPLTVVFDAHFQSEPVKRGTIGELDVIFTASGQSADNWILDELQTVRNPRLFTIITSDKTLAMHARHLGAYTVSVDEFLKKLAKKKPKFIAPQKIVERTLLKEEISPFQESIPSAKPDDTNLMGYYEQAFTARLESLGFKESEKDYSKISKVFESDYERWLRLFTKKDKKRIP